MAIDILRKNYNLNIESPFTVKIGNRSIYFDALIKGYGAKNGMIIDDDGSKFTKYSDSITKLDYGYSCFNIHSESVGDEFDDVLDDWGKTGI